MYKIKFLDRPVRQFKCLSGADLTNADLTGADLRNANLIGADLKGADLGYTILKYANFTGANLKYANFTGANIFNTKFPSPTMVLLANWGNVSNILCIELMRYDAFCHSDSTAFDKWKKDRTCPYANTNYQRACNFQEIRKLWSPGPCKNIHSLMEMVLAEKCISID